MHESKVGFTGTQSGMTETQRLALSKTVSEILPSEAHHGDCVGADAQFHEICLGVGVPVVIHPPSETKKRAYCENAQSVLEPRDYLKRNRDIVDAVEKLLATPDGPEKVRSGTWSTIRYARKKGIEVVVVMPDGSLVG